MSTEQDLRPVNTVLPADLADRALHVANDLGVSRSELIRRLLTTFLASVDAEQCATNPSDTNPGN